jgi:hypothetical protein
MLLGEVVEVANVLSQATPELQRESTPDVAAPISVPKIWSDFHG